MKNFLYFIIPAAISYFAILLLMNLLLNILGIFYDFNIFDPECFIILNIICFVTFYPVVGMKYIYQIIRSSIDKDYLKRISHIESTKSISELAEEHFQNLEVQNKYMSGDDVGARRLREHFDEINTLKQIEKNTRKK